MRRTCRFHKREYRLLPDLGPVCSHCYGSHEFLTVEQHETREKNHRLIHWDDQHGRGNIWYFCLTHNHSYVG